MKSLSSSQHRQHFPRHSNQPDQFHSFKMQFSLFFLATLLGLAAADCKFCGPVDHPSCTDYDGNTICARKYSYVFATKVCCDNPNYPNISCGRDCLTTW